jgi:glycine/serine hydroxymethyltransferase
MASDVGFQDIVFSTTHKTRETVRGNLDHTFTFFLMSARKG